MLNLSKAVLPDSVKIGDEYHKVQSDFRYGLIFARMIQKEKHEPEDFAFFFPSGMPLDSENALLALTLFYFPQNELPRITGRESGEIITDYEIDADLIYSAFYGQYGIDLIDTKMHWYKFRALFLGLKATKLNEVMQFRAYEPNENDSKKYKEYMLDVKRAWEIETPMTDEEKEALEHFNSLFE